MTLTEARSIVGSIGFPSKMPGTSYALPAKACIAGAALARVQGSICSVCYALSGKANYQMPRAMRGQERRLAAITHPQWVHAMALLLGHLHRQMAIRVDLGIVGIRLQRSTGLRSARYRWNEPGYHRWHDSGDLQSVEHLQRIFEVCRRTPSIKHWLPTRELAIVRSLHERIPDNLTIRVSATMVDGPTPSGWPLGSTVHQGIPQPGAHICPAPQQDHQCGQCRACWSRNVPLVSYALH